MTLNYVNYLGKPVSVSNLTPTREKTKNTQQGGFIDYTGLEPEIEFQAAQLTDTETGKLLFLFNGIPVEADFVTLERLGIAYYKIVDASAVQCDDEGNTYPEEKVVTLLEKEANSKTQVINAILKNLSHKVGVIPSLQEVVLWDRQYKDDGTCQLVYKVGGKELVAETQCESIGGEVHDLPVKIIDFPGQLSMTAEELLKVMRELALQEIIDSSGPSPWPDAPPF